VARARLPAASPSVWRIVVLAEERTMSQPPHPHQDDDPFGRPSYVPPPYPPPGQDWAPGGPGGGPPSSRTTAIALVVAGLVVLAAVGVGAFVLGRTTANDLAGRLSSLASAASSAAPSLSAGPKWGAARPYQPRSTNTSLPPPAVPPTGLGSDPHLDRYARDCFDGDMLACDDLFAESDSNSLYEAYGDTCAGRQEPGTEIYCTTAFPDR
jgi:hypothetical protein